MEVVKPKIGVLADLVFDKNLLPALWTASSLLYLHMTGRSSSDLLSSSFKDTNPILGAPPSWHHASLITSQKPWPLIPSHWKLAFQHTNLGGDNQAVHNSMEKNVKCFLNNFLHWLHVNMKIYWVKENKLLKLIPTLYFYFVFKKLFILIGG